MTSSTARAWSFCRASTEKEKCALARFFGRRIASKEVVALPTLSALFHTGWASVRDDAGGEARLLLAGVRLLVLFRSVDRLDLTQDDIYTRHYLAELDLSPESSTGSLTPNKVFTARREGVVREPGDARRSIASSAWPTLAGSSKSVQIECLNGPGLFQRPKAGLLSLKNRLGKASEKGIFFSCASSLCADIVVVR